MGKVLLVQPRYNYVRNFAEAPSVALLILGTLAENAGHEVKLLHLDIDQLDVPTACKLFKPDIVGITVNTLQVKSARITVKQVRQISKEIKIVVGGPHAPFWDGEADELVVGEGENRWLEILGEQPWVNEIDDVPTPNYGMVDFSKFCGFEPGQVTPTAVVMGSRGCPYNCVFCNTPLFWGKKVRYRSPELMVDEVSVLSEVYGVREVTFQDDTFNLNHPWAMEIFERLIQKGLNRKVLLRMTSRASERLVTKEFLDLAKRAGVWYVFYGIESGSQAMLDRMQKGIAVWEIKRAIRMTKEAGLLAYCSFVVGLPGETWETLMETDRLIAEIQPNSYNWAYACPFPGTKFDKEVIASGHKRPIDFEEYSYGKLIARTDALSLEDLASFKGFNWKGGQDMKSWKDVYSNVCGSRRLLEGNIMRHGEFVVELARLVMPGDKVLEVGSGTGVMGWPLAGGGAEVTSLDNDEEILRMAAINARVLGAEIKYVLGDGFALPFKDDSFQVCFSEGLLEHYEGEDIERLVKEQLRVAPLVVVGVPLEGCMDLAKGDEHFLPVTVWEDRLKDLGLFRGTIYNDGTRACFTLARVGVGQGAKPGVAGGEN